MVKEAERNAALAHFDDFNNTLHLFPYTTQATLSSNLPTMDEVIKKCNHIITRRQTSKWVDDSWLLIGKANFFKGDFFAAIEAFEFVVASYKNKPIRYEAEIWAVKSLIMLEKFDEASALCELMIADPKFPKKLNKDLYLVSAEALISQERYNEAYERLKIALPKIKRSDHRYRIHYVAGQLAMINGKSEKAISYFSRVTRLTPPYEFDFFSRINMVKLYAAEPLNNIKKGRSILDRMLTDDKNLELLDEIYFQLALLDLKENKKQDAIYHLKSALAQGQNTQLKSEMYLIIAELYFEGGVYTQAQLYYDSAVQVLNPQNPEFEQINNKHQILTALITALVDIDYQDSMLRLATDEGFRKRTLEQIKEEERRRKEEEEWLKDNPYNNDQFMGMSGGGMPGGGGGPGGPSAPVITRFPFYDAQLKTKGNNDFKMKWGSRELTDFWRVKALAETILNSEEEEEDMDEEEDWDEEDEENLDKELAEERVLPDDINEEDADYFANVPFTESEKEEALKSMGQSYFQAANLYREKLNEPEKAKMLLDAFLTKLKDNPFRENALYLLVKIYDSEGNTEMAQKFKNQLMDEYPESEFLIILDQPEKYAEKKESSSPDKKVKSYYHRFYNYYTNKQFDSLEYVYKKIKQEHPGSVMDGQFDFMYALYLIEQGNQEEYLNIMQDLAATFSGTELGDLAQARIDAYNRLFGEVEDESGQAEMASSLYVKSDGSGPHHFIMKLERHMDVNIAKIGFSDFNRDFRSRKPLKITTTFVGTQTRVLVVTGFEKQKEVIDYIKDIKNNKKLLENLKSNAEDIKLLHISKDHFSTLMEEKIWDDYETYFIKTYL